MNKIHFNLQIVTRQMGPIATFLLGSSWKTTLTGYASAILMTILDFAVTNGLDISSQAKRSVLFGGLGVAILTAVRARFTQDVISGRLKGEGVMGQFAEYESEHLKRGRQT